MKELKKEATLLFLAWFITFVVSIYSFAFFKMDSNELHNVIGYEIDVIDSLHRQITVRDCVNIKNQRTIRDLQIEYKKIIAPMRKPSNNNSEQ